MKLWKRLKKWKDWRRYSNMRSWQKLLVLLGLMHSPSFDNW